MARVTLWFKDKALKVIPLSEEEMIIGRNAECAIHIDSLALQPMHACIRHEPDRFRLIALDPDDPPMIGGQPIENHILKDGDRIQLGKHCVTFAESARTMIPEEVEPMRVNRDAVGWMQIMSGSHIGRTIRLDRPMTRIGKTGKRSAMVSRRKDGYYISHLEGSKPTRVNGKEIGPRAEILRDGDRVKMGRLELQFFIDSAGAVIDDAESTVEPGEQRTFTRVAFNARVTVVNDERHWQSRIIDLSVKGALVAKPQDWDGIVGDLFQLEIMLADEAEIKMNVHVAHVEDEEIGFHCEHIDLESVTHLRRLVELNLGTTKLLDRELAALA